MAQVQQRVLAAAAALALAWPDAAAARRFYGDDPLMKMPKPLPVKEIKRRKVSEFYDFLYNTFEKPGEKQRPRAQIAAQDVNTVGEVPDGSWFVNRHGHKRMSIEELVQGAGYSPAPSTSGAWDVTAAKSEGVTPGFTIRDSTGRRYQLKFDIKEVYELGSGADVMGSKFYWAIGYWAPQNYIVYFPLEQLRVPPKTKFTDKRGRERDLRQDDIDDIMAAVPKDDRGRYRAIASAYLPGQPIGPWSYDGVRSDDPNDYIPHEHTRVLRGLRVFNSWLSHTDAKSLNGLDTVVDDGGVRHVRHHLIDFSAAFGAEAFEPKSPRAGYVYMFDWSSSAREFFTLGLAPPAWSRAHYEHVNGVGRMESKVFDPEKWVPNYYSPAFANLLPDDAFWAAKIVMRFTEPEIRALVDTAEYSDKAGVDYLVRVLMERQRKIGATWFSKVLPLDHLRVEDGRLAFDDLGVQYGYVQQPRTYQTTWSEFDNETERKTAIAGASGMAIPRSAAQFLTADIHAGDPELSVTVYLRRRGNHREVVGIDRGWKGKSLVPPGTNLTQNGGRK